MYQKNCYEIFDKYFLTNNTFYDICDTQGMHVDSSLFGSAFGGVNQPKLPPLSNIEVVVPTTLKEFYNGCVKTINYTKQTVALDGKTLEQTVCNKQIEVKPGMDVDSKQHFMGEGHQQPGQNASNLYVNFQLMAPNPSSSDFEVTRRYQRIRNDLVYRHKITLQEAIHCKPVKIPLLDGGQALLAIDEVI